jgi:hypothetical protein
MLLKRLPIMTGHIIEAEVNIGKKTIEVNIGKKNKNYEYN